MSNTDKDEVRVTLRLPSDLHEAIAKAAKRETRSLNGQIVALLRRAIAGEDAAGSGKR